MRKEDSESLGAEGYIPSDLLTRIKSKSLHVTTSFMLSDKTDVMARSFAVSFYKELRRLGFTDDQVADFSTELLKILLAKLEAYKEKIKRKQQ